MCYESKNQRAIENPYYGQLQMDIDLHRYQVETFCEMDVDRKAMWDTEKAFEEAEFDQAYETAMRMNEEFDYLKQFEYDGVQGEPLPVSLALPNRIGELLNEKD